VAREHRQRRSNVASDASTSPAVLQRRQQCFNVASDVSTSLAMLQRRWRCFNVAGDVERRRGANFSKDRSLVV
jgi:hypothetical protein